MAKFKEKLAARRARVITFNRPLAASGSDLNHSMKVGAFRKVLKKGAMPIITIAPVSVSGGSTPRRVQ
jgi:hypothetical protein